MASDPGKEKPPVPGAAVEDGRMEIGANNGDPLPCSTPVHSEKTNLRVDRMAGWLQIYLSTPAGPLSRDTLSLGGFSFFGGDVA